MSSRVAFSFSELDIGVLQGRYNEGSTSGRNDKNQTQNRSLIEHGSGNRPIFSVYRCVSVRMDPSFFAVIVSRAVVAAAQYQLVPKVLHLQHSYAATTVILIQKIES